MLRVLVRVAKWSPTKVKAVSEPAATQFRQEVAGVLGRLSMIGHTVREGEIPVKAALPLVLVEVEPSQADTYGRVAEVGACDAGMVLSHTIR